MDHRCRMCAMIDHHPLRVRALFRVMVAGDTELFDALERLARLFHDAGAQTS